MPRAKPLTRDQLARFLPTPEAIRAFEVLFQDSNDYGEDILALYALVSDTEIGNALAGAKANQAIAAINRLSDALEMVALAPPVREGRGFVIKNLDADASIAIGEFADVDASAANRTITLPPPDGCPGQMLGVAKNDSSANTVTVSGQINGASSAVITIQYTALWLISTGSEWRAW